MALDFNGTDQSAQAAIDLSSHSTITISWWARRNSNASGGMWFELGSNYHSFDDSFGTSSDAGGLNRHYFAYEEGSSNNIWQMTSAEMPGYGVWGHFTWVMDKTLSTNEFTVYLDGVQTGGRNSNFNHTGSFGNRTLYVGARAGASIWADFSISQLAIYQGDQGARAPELAKMTPLQAAPEDLLYFWPMHGGSLVEVIQGASLTSNSGTAYPDPHFVRPSAQVIAFADGPRIDSVSTDDILPDTETDWNISGVRFGSR